MPLRSKTLFYSLGYLILSLLLFSREPDVLLHAQFWGEDGWFWFPDAYHYGISSLYLPHTGYLQTDDRIVAFSSLLLPLRDIPTLFAVMAFFFQWLPCAFLLSPRCKNLFPSTIFRFFIATLVCLIPNSWEVYVNLTNSQWHLAFLALLIVCSAPPRSIADKLFDISFLILSGLSGPFCLFLLPVAFLRTAIERSSTNITRFCIVMSTAIIQCTTILLTGERTHMLPNLGASPSKFTQILGGPLFLSPVIGRDHIKQLELLHSWQTGWLPWGITLVGLLLCLYAFQKISALRLPLIFATIVLTAGLTHPAGSSTTAWDAFLVPNTGMRYFYIPLCIWIITLATLTFKGSIPIRFTSGLILFCALSFGFRRDWHYPKENDRGFTERANYFDTALLGTIVTLPIRPGTFVTITK
ncbi:hypothetical protein [Swingsia samuiensis]|uniref:DUF2029 domain-containing protein n=1 Tax=Swingsia samuiensis TaxID=1293412 RepID=A0A4Y6UJ76_9PROT|nr:hypothetical protein [Swingsia samuiensis]QDH17612.1 hypothetical protein E3D00_08590 [Swingsia samuiensis]